MFEENPNLLIEQNIDDLAEQHINEFWEHYGLKLKMKVEHKIENFSLKSAYFNKANSLFIVFKFKHWGQRDLNPHDQ